MQFRVVKDPARGNEVALGRAAAVAASMVQGQLPTAKRPGCTLSGGSEYSFACREYVLSVGHSNSTRSTAAASPEPVVVIPPSS